MLLYMDATNGTKSLNDIAVSEHAKLIEERKAVEIRRFRTESWRRFQTHYMFNF